MTGMDNPLLHDATLPAFQAIRPEHIEPAESRHDQIQHDDLRLKRCNLDQGGGAILGNRDVISVTGECSLQRPANFRFVIDNQHPITGHAKPLFRAVS